MEKFRVTVFFTDKTVVVSAKNKTEAKQKAYSKFKKKNASSIISKKETIIE